VEHAAFEVRPPPFKLKRAAVFSARCKDTNKLLNLRGTFAYSGTQQATDTVIRRRPARSASEPGDPAEFDGAKPGRTTSSLTGAMTQRPR